MSQVDSCAAVKQKEAGSSSFIYTGLIRHRLIAMLIGTLFDPRTHERHVFFSLMVLGIKPKALCMPRGNCTFSICRPENVLISQGQPFHTNKFHVGIQLGKMERVETLEGGYPCPTIKLSVKDETYEKSHDLM